MRIAPLPSLQWAGATDVNLVRNIPLTVVMMFAAFALWPQLGVTFSENLDQNFFWLAVWALSVYTASFVCESIRDRKSTRLNSSHVAISYAVFCLKKKNYTNNERYEKTRARRK